MRAFPATCSLKNIEWSKELAKRTHHWHLHTNTCIHNDILNLSKKMCRRVRSVEECSQNNFNFFAAVLGKYFSINAKQFRNMGNIRNNSSYEIIASEYWYFNDNVVKRVSMQLRVISQALREHRIEQQVVYSMKTSAIK